LIDHDDNIVHRRFRHGVTHSPTARSSFEAHLVEIDNLKVIAETRLCAGKGNITYHLRRSFNREQIIRFNTFVCSSRLETVFGVSFWF